MKKLKFWMTYWYHVAMITWAKFEIRMKDEKYTFEELREKLGYRSKF